MNAVLLVLAVVPAVVVAAVRLAQVLLLLALARTAIRLGLLSRSSRLFQAWSIIRL